MHDGCDYGEDTKVCESVGSEYKILRMMTDVLTMMYDRPNIYLRVKGEINESREKELLVEII